jgi:hypothetical protein
MSDERYQAFGRCWSCGALFSFNPHLVPSVPVDPVSNQIAEHGVPRPICRTCAQRANVHRRASELSLWFEETAKVARLRALAGGAAPVRGLPE